MDGDDDDNSLSPCQRTGPQLDEVLIALQPLERRAWLKSLSPDPIKLVSDIVCHIRASDARKQVFAKIVQLCTKDEPRSRGGQLLQLIQHIKTQWDSVYLMLQHFCLLRKAVEMYFANESTIESTRLTTTDWEILESIEGVLVAAHIILQTMLSESMPVLCGTVASFELLMSQWERLGKEHLELQYWTKIGLHWAEKYYKQMDDTDAYVIAMGRSLFSDYTITESHKSHITYLLRFLILPYTGRGSAMSGVQNTTRDPRRSYSAM
ncbi:hypothetical protein EI94DRAFT_1586636 [Lactarius quietus]|nr:hypothetical protein EI94DRAFT_1586636 [Lactarius quietus]